MGFPTKTTRRPRLWLSGPFPEMAVSVFRPHCAIRASPSKVLGEAEAVSAANRCLTNSIGPIAIGWR